jgi:type I restriction enzyme S subunit
VNNLVIPLPPLDEQRGIVGVLGVVDSVIAKTGEVIAKTERLKKGLMQTLLTRGIGHKEYKQTPIGTTPKTWQVVRISSIGQISTGKTPSTQNDEYWNGEIPFITPADVKEFKYVYETERHVTQKGANQSNILPKDTVLTVCIGSTIGKVALTYEESVTNQQINAIICDKEIVDPHYVYYTLLFKAHLLKSFSGIAAVPIVKKSLFEQFMIPIPPIPEQKRIAEILSLVDSKLELERKEKAKLERIKRGLMDLLLTGKIRVKVD